MAIDALGRGVNNTLAQQTRATNAKTESAATENTRAAAYARSNGTVVTPEATSRADAVVLTDSAKSLSRAGEKARSSDGVDQGKVEKLKAAIKDGSYKINYESIASRMIDSEDELNSIFG